MLWELLAADIERVEDIGAVGNEKNIYYIYSQGIDMRKGVEGLCGIIRTYQYSSTNQALRTIVWLKFSLKKDYEYPFLYENLNCMSYKLFQILPYKQNAIARYYCALPRFYQSYLILYSITELIQCLVPS